MHILKKTRNLKIRQGKIAIEQTSTVTHLERIENRFLGLKMSYLKII